MSNQTKARFLLGIISALIISAISHIGYILLISYPRVEAKVETISELKEDIKEIKSDIKELLKR